jgi:hypothetical protein
MSVGLLNRTPCGSASPETSDAIPNIAAMRQAIVCATHDSGLIRQCLEVAERHDLEEEEMYVWLAYHALSRIEELPQRVAREPAETSDIGMDELAGERFSR